MAQRKGGKFLSQEYRGTAVKHDWECCEGHQWKTTPNSIQSGTWCPFCADRRPYTLEDLREFAKTHDGQCLATEYVNSKTQVLWQCNQAHQWWVAFHDIKKRKAWCPICAMAGKGWWGTVYIVMVYLELYTQFYSQFTPSFDPDSRSSAISLHHNQKAWMPYIHKVMMTLYPL